MTKRFCDICGKEIMFTKDRYSISIENARSSDAEYSMSATDVCSDCTNSIYHYIEGLKSLLTNQLNCDNVYDKEVM